MVHRQGQRKRGTWVAVVPPSESLGASVPFCSPKNLEGAIHGGRSAGHRFSFLDLAPGRQFDNIGCPQSTRSTRADLTKRFRAAHYRPEQPSFNQRALCRLNGTVFCQRVIHQCQRGPFSLSEGPPLFRWALRRSRDLLLVKRALHRFTEAVVILKGPSNGSWSPLSNNEIFP